MAIVINNTKGIEYFSRIFLPSNTFSTVYEERITKGTIYIGHSLLDAHLKALERYGTLSIIVMPYLLDINMKKMKSIVRKRIRR